MIYVDAYNAKINDPYFFKTIFDNDLESLKKCKYQ